MPSHAGLRRLTGVSPWQRSEPGHRQISVLFPTPRSLGSIVPCFLTQPRTEPSRFSMPPGPMKLAWKDLGFWRTSPNGSRPTWIHTSTSGTLSGSLCSSSPVSTISIGWPSIWRPGRAGGSAGLRSSTNSPAAGIHGSCPLSWRRPTTPLWFTFFISCGEGNGPSRERLAWGISNDTPGRKI